MADSPTNLSPINQYHTTNPNLNNQTNVLDNIEEKLLKIKKLFDSGLITEKEYQDKKKDFHSFKVIVRTKKIAKIGIHGCFYKNKNV